MKLRHEGMLFGLGIAAVTLVASLFTAVCFVAPNWALSGRIAVFGVVLVAYLVVVILASAIYFEDRGKRVRMERKRSEEEKIRQLKLAQLRAGAGEVVEPD